MQTWKLKRRRASSSASKGILGIRLLTVFMLLLTVASAFYDFPSVWNQTAKFVNDKTPITLPTSASQAFRLGLDLQGGTHLVYAADMSQIPDSERAAALSGVKDVIERRVNAFGVSEPIVQTSDTNGSYRVIVELAGVLDVNEAIKQIGETPVLEFKEQESNSIDH